MERKLIDRYFDEIINLNPLSLEEEKNLSERILKGDGRAADKLVTAAVPMLQELKNHISWVFKHDVACIQIYLSGSNAVRQITIVFFLHSFTLLLFSFFVERFWDCYQQIQCICEFMIA